MHKNYILGLNKILDVIVSIDGGTLLRDLIPSRATYHITGVVGGHFELVEMLTVKK